MNHATVNPPDDLQLCRHSTLPWVRREMWTQHLGCQKCVRRGVFWHHSATAPVTHSSISVSVQTWLLFPNRLKKPNTPCRYKTTTAQHLSQSNNIEEASARAQKLKGETGPWKVLMYPHHASITQRLSVKRKEMPQDPLYVCVFGGSIYFL